ncbi:hypothetical protein V8B97DRAFT_1913909 [Scleroderma yunnanense]
MITIPASTVKEDLDAGIQERDSKIFEIARGCLEYYAWLESIAVFESSVHYAHEGERKPCGRSKVLTNGHAAQAGSDPSNPNDPPGCKDPYVNASSGPTLGQRSGGVSPEAAYKPYSQNVGVKDGTPGVGGVDVGQSQGGRAGVQ